MRRRRQKSKIFYRRDFYWRGSFFFIKKRGRSAFFISLLCGIIKIVFLCVYHSLIMRDVNYGWLIRYLHANTASFFFIFVYLHIGRGLYYGSYKSPRTLLWSIGVVILILMMAIAFLGFIGLAQNEII